MDGRRQLALAFEGWVELMGYNQSQIAAMGGPSTTTQTMVRRSSDPVGKRTLQQIDAVTGWPAGTASRLLAGRMLAQDALVLTPSLVQSATLADFTDEELLDEVRRRMQRSAHAQQEPTTGSDGRHGEVTDLHARRSRRAPSQGLLDEAARPNQHGRGRAIDAEFERLCEESQDEGGS